jgi:hypothetical protein
MRTFAGVYVGRRVENLREQYEVPEVTDYGDLMDITGHKGADGAEDGCGKTVDGAVCVSQP